ncbi:hypothetical protein BXO88_11610 [Oribacterium sp. C9]|uniref:hydroxyethylthiazole kinase n=1 Tax=Oribacterium sp. C9 TaxID=1943579 RepID=UPI00098FAB0D|nr:hydroxyethylthiazole kinase [Oribacterium sp. C9]OON85576.1 hypothetical protein BXO88_11610 [Oribacterium sp. C9]
MDLSTEISDIIKKHRPLIHSITNYVTVNDCANALLAIGARPVMSHAPEEAMEITSGSDGLELNLGATEYYESMLLSGKEAFTLGIPLLIDPVGVSGSAHRRNFLKKLIENCYPTAIRGNRSEILAMIRDEKTETGVDSVRFDANASDESLLSEMKDFCRAQKERYETKGAVHQLILICSGKTDLVASCDDTAVIDGGSSEMSGVTGTGCMSSVVMTAFIAGARMYNREIENPENQKKHPKCMPVDKAHHEQEIQSETVKKIVSEISDFEACVSAVRYIDAAAERAEANLNYLRKMETLPYGTFGTGSYRVLFMDQLSGFKH